MRKTNQEENIEMKAFPHKVMSAQQGQGMDLRDYFAAKALTGLLTEASGDYQDEAIAGLAYALADAMMKAREAK
jgi:hypothetical protein